MDILDIIKTDHDKVKDLTSRLEATNNGDVLIRKENIQTLGSLATAHMRAEERVFYPALAGQIPDMINKSLAEHQLMDACLKEVSDTPPDDDMWIANLLVCKDVTLRHIQEEEGPIFDAARRAFSSDQLNSMGDQFQREEGTVPTPPGYLPVTAGVPPAASARGAAEAAAVAGTAAAGTITGAAVPTYVPSAPATALPTLISANSLKGNKVRNAQGEDLGKIEELMFDLDTGRIAYAVLSFGGFLGVGDKLFAVPWNALTLDTERKEYLLNVDKETLKKAPGFDKDNWPDTADETWVKSVHSYYGQKPSWER